MFVLGHLGIGPRLLGRLRLRLPQIWLLLGCLLPDLIDKPLFYGLLFAEGHPDAVITGSRSVGHTGIFLLLLLLAAALTRRPALWALAAGVATHFVLDIGGELTTGGDPDAAIWLSLFYPAYGHFPVAQFGSMFEHLRISAQNVYVVMGEIVGAVLLYFSWRGRRRPQSS